MRIESRYELGQKVWHINNVGREQFIACPSCIEGKVPLPDGRCLPCPRCNGKGVVAQRYINKYVVSEPMTVGQIEIKVGGKDEDDHERYMTYERGVGSGSVFYGRDLFATPEIAQAECDKRNHEPGQEWSCVQCNPEFEPVKYTALSEYRYCVVHKQATHVDPEKAQAILDQRKPRADGGGKG